MRQPKSIFELLSFGGIVIAFFFMAAALLDDITFQSVRNAVIAVVWVLIAIWCQRESSK